MEEPDLLIDRLPSVTHMHSATNQGDYAPISQEGFEYTSREKASMEPVIDHIQITVKDMIIAVPFYDKFLELLGFDVKNKVSAVIDEHDFYVVEYTHPLLSFAITSPRKSFIDETINRRKPGALHHIAFKAKSRAEVDRFYSQIEMIGATIVSKPKLYPEYESDYYALFFKDLEGIKYEIVCNEKIETTAQ